MYNEEMKTKFIETYTDDEYTRMLCVMLFSHAEKYEKKWRADICTKSAAEVKQCVEEIMTDKKSTIAQRIRVFRAYSKWCVQMGYPGACGGLQEVQVKGFEKIRNRMVMGPEHLQVCLNKVCRPDTFDTTDNTFRVICWLAFNGVTDEDLCNIRGSDVNFNNFTYRYYASDHPIYPEAVRAFKSCVYADVFATRGESPATAVSFRNRVPGDSIIRGVRGTPTVKAIRVDFSRRKSRIDDEIDFSLDRIRNSGRFYRWRMMERMGIRPEIERIVTEEVLSQEHSVANDEHVTKLIKRKIRSTIEDYNNWKNAFI